jgi:hypothetical protein
MDQLERWHKKEFMQLKEQIATTEGTEIPEELETKLISIIAYVWYPSCIWLKTDAPISELVVAVKELVATSIGKPGLYETNIMAQTRDALATQGDLQFKYLLPLLPRLARLNSSLGSPTDLSDLWKHARQKLIEWGIRRFQQEI